MEKKSLGEILRDRIKEKGYTQEEYAEIIGLPLETLKNYINGKTEYYTIDLLIKFADTLDCSYDYLLGKSKATNQENHLLVEELGLSDKAIDTIKTWKNSDIADVRENLLYTLDKIICKEGFIYVLALFILSNKKFVSLGNELTESITNVPMDEIGLDAQKQLFLGMIYETLGELREENKGDIILSDETMKALSDIGMI